MKMLETNDLNAHVSCDLVVLYVLYLIFQGVPKPSRTAFYLCAHRH